MKLTFILFLHFVSIYTYCQNTDKQIVLKVVGDLNSDNLTDEVIVKKDSTNNSYPFILNVFLLDDNKKMKLIASSQKIVLQARNRNKLINLQSYCTLKIMNNKLTVDYNLDSEHYIYTFGFQNLDFILLEYYGEFNNSQGKQIEKYESKNGKTEIIIKDRNDQIINRKEKIEPLKKLEDFEVNI